MLTKIDPNARPPARYLDEILLGSGGNLIAGFWLVAAPTLLDYSNGDPVVVDVCAGASIAALAVARATHPARRAWFSWINALLGSVLVLAALFLAETATAATNEAVVGILVILFAVLSAGATGAAKRNAR